MDVCPDSYAKIETKEECLVASAELDRDWTSSDGGAQMFLPGGCSFGVDGTVEFKPSAVPTAPTATPINFQSTTILLEGLGDIDMDGCYTIDKVRMPLDMAGQVQTKLNSAEKCQRRCQSVNGCAYFSWQEKPGTCHLQDDDSVEVGKPGLRLTITGPKTCGGSHTLICQLVTEVPII